MPTPPNERLTPISRAHCLSNTVAEAEPNNRLCRFRQKSLRGSGQWIGSEFAD
jgi:hypothetical protein